MERSGLVADLPHPVLSPARAARPTQACQACQNHGQAAQRQQRYRAWEPASLHPARPQHRRCTHIAHASLTSNDLKNGMAILMNGEPWKVIEFQHVKPGKGSAVVRSKLKSLKRGTVTDKTFRAGEPLEKAEINGREAMFSYLEGDNYVFMDLESYEELKIPKDKEWADYIQEGTEVKVSEFNGAVIDVEIPITMVLEIERTEQAVQGNRSQSDTKPATLSTGKQIQVPLFVEQGEKVKVDTREGKYIGRASKEES